MVCGLIKPVWYKDLKNEVTCKPIHLDIEHFVIVYTIDTILPGGLVSVSKEMLVFITGHIYEDWQLVTLVFISLQQIWWIK